MAIGCRTAPRDEVVFTPAAESPRTLATSGQGRILEKDPLKEFEENYQNMLLDDSRFKSARAELDRYREKTNSAEPLAEVDGIRIYQFGDRFYGMLGDDTEPLIEVAGDGWKQHNDRVVMTGRAVCYGGNLTGQSFAKESSVTLWSNGRITADNGGTNTGQRMVRFVIPVNGDGEQ